MTGRGQTAQQQLRDTIDFVLEGKPIDFDTFLAAMREAGYERFAKVFNLKQAAQTLIYLQEHGLNDYADLAEKASAAWNEALL